MKVSWIPLNKIKTVCHLLSLVVYNNHALIDLMIYSQDTAAEKEQKINISKNAALMMLKTGTVLKHMYTKAWNFLLQMCNVLMK